jgi:tetratricopeptide (TPR) repeat protein/DNA-binding SARP family transcriptional activator
MPGHRSAELEARVLVQVLGPVRAWSGGRELDLGPASRRAVLGLLTLALGQPVPRQEIVDALWGERPPSTANNVIHTHVKHLRRLLEPGRRAYAPSASLPSVGDGYAFRVPAGEVDLARFRDLVTAAAEAERAGTLPHTAEMLGEAVRFWQGPPLADLPVLAAHPRVLALAAERWGAVARYGDIMISLGYAERALPILAEAAASLPMDEAAQARLVRAHHAAGQRARAFQVFEIARRRLATELGVDPGPALNAAHEALVRDGDRAGRGPMIRQSTATPTVAARPAAKQVPSQLPADVFGFTGRAVEIGMLDRLLPAAPEAQDQTAQTSRPGQRAGPPTEVTICVVCGTAGVGKTAVSVHWAHRVVEGFPEGQIYIDLRGYDPDQPMSTGDALTRLLDALGVPPADVPLDLDRRAARYRTEITGRRILLVLDNAASLEQIRLLLPGTSTCRVLVTSRDNLAGLVVLHGAYRITLDSLPHADATALLRTLIGPRAEAEPEHAATLADQCNRLPLALRVAAELAITRPRMSLANMVGELANRQRRLRMLDAGGESRAAVRTVFSWSYQHLRADVARTFRLLGLHPGQNLDRYAVAALIDADLEATGRLLDRLARTHLVRTDGTDRFGMHDLLRAYAVELTHATDSPADRSAAMVRLYSHYVAVAASAMRILYPAERTPPRQPTPPVTGPTSARAWLDAERDTLAAICASAAQESPSHAVGLATTIYRYLEGGHYTVALAIHGDALGAAQRSGDRSGQAYCLTNIGATYRLLGMYPTALEHLRQALDLHRQTGDRYGEARTLSNLGIVEDRRGHRDSAAVHLNQALALYRELRDRYGEAAVRTNLGGVYNGLAQDERAAEHLERAVTLFAEIEDRVGQASALSNLGELHIALGRYASAADHLERALALFRDSEHRYGQAVALANLGLVQTNLDHPDQAVAHLRRAIRIFRATGHRYGEASALNSLGEALLAGGSPTEVLALHSRALAIATDTGDSDEQERARTGIARAERAGL